MANQIYETLLNASWTLYHLDKSHDNQVLAWTNKAMKVPSNSGAPYFLQAYLFMRQQNYEKAEEVMKRCMPYLEEGSSDYNDAQIINQILDTQLSR